jgi:uncharacterized OsmC-like protein
MPYKAEIRTARESSGAVSPRSIVVEHHRAGTAAIEVEMLSGGHLLHLALAGCVFNNVLRIAGDKGIVVDQASVQVDGGFTEDGHSTGMECRIDVSGNAEPSALRALAREAFDDSTVGAVLRNGASVELRQ